MLPSRSILSPTPVCLSNSAVPCSRTPARTVVSTTLRLRSSSTTDSMPCRCSRCESSVPAGPPPTIPTCVRIIPRSLSGTSLAGFRAGSCRRGWLHLFPRLLHEQEQHEACQDDASVQHHGGRPVT